MRRLVKVNREHTWHTDLADPVTFRLQGQWHTAFRTLLAKTGWEMSQ